jgi:hypothetical protein
MRPSKYLSLFVVCSLMVTGCRGQGPKVTVCILDPVAETLYCGDPDGNQSERPLAQLPPESQYACLTLDDLQLLLNYAKEKCK